MQHTALSSSYRCGGRGVLAAVAALEARQAHKSSDEENSAALESPGTSSGACSARDGLAAWRRSDAMHRCGGDAAAPYLARSRLGAERGGIRGRTG